MDNLCVVSLDNAKMKMDDTDSTPEARQEPPEPVNDSGKVESIRLSPTSSAPTKE